MKLLAFLIAFGVASTSFALPTGHRPENEPSPAQYQRSCMSTFMYSKTATITTGARRFIDGNGDPVVLRWGSQIEATCTGADATTEGGDAALIFFHQEPNDKYLTKTRLNCTSNDGCPWLDDTLGVSGVEGPLPGPLVLKGQSKYRRISATPFNGTMNPRFPTWRGGRCTAASDNTNVVGGPCDTDDECGSSSGVCSKILGRADGVFVSMMVTDVNLSCYIEVCF